MILMQWECNTTFMILQCFQGFRHEFVDFFRFLSSFLDPMILHKVISEFIQIIYCFLK